MTTTRRAIGLGLLAAPFVIPAARAEARNAMQMMEGVATISIFFEAVKSHGLESEFTAAGSFGFWVPVNHGIEALPSGLFRRLERDREYARETILNHISTSARPIAWGGNMLSETVSLRSKAGNRLSVSLGTGMPRINGQPILRANIPASNGLMFGIDGVLQV
jgi:uncharacterized surface protein with fasciclin (FAS1) repeats